jgi:hypothetical protein
MSGDDVPLNQGVPHHQIEIVMVRHIVRRPAVGARRMDVVVVDLTGGPICFSNANQSTGARNQARAAGIQPEVI